jgi:2'-5' RNA ligase
MRTFIAIDLNPEIKQNILSLIRQLSRSGAHVKWVSLQGMHLTLKFLGEISPEKAGEIKGLLKGFCARHTSFSLKCQGTGWFPPGSRNPRVFWVGLEENPSLISLQSELEHELEKMGFPREGRPFHPHLTLGRVRQSAGIKPVIEELEKHKEVFFGQMVVGKLTFFESTLKPTGAEYTVISELFLK